LQILIILHNFHFFAYWYVILINKYGSKLLIKPVKGLHFKYLLVLSTRRRIPKWTSKTTHPHVTFLVGSHVFLNQTILHIQISSEHVLNLKPSQGRFKTKCCFQEQCFADQRGNCGRSCEVRQQRPSEPISRMFDPQPWYLATVLVVYINQIKENKNIYEMNYQSRWAILIYRFYKHVR